MDLNNFAPQIIRFIKKCSIFTAVCNSKGRIVCANEYANRIAGCEIKGFLLSELFVDFTTSFKLEDAAKDGSQRYLININTKSDNPETLYFSFYSSGEHTLIFGEYDYSEVDSLRNSLISTNSVISTLNRDLSKKNVEHEELNKTLKMMNVELKNLNETKNMFVGMAAHDLKSPLNGIILACHILRMEGYKNDLVIETVDMVHQQATYMVDMITNLLDIASIESGTFHLHKINGSIINVIEESIRVHNLLAERRELKFIKNYRELCSTSFDPSKIRQVVDNLLSNAIKYTNENTNIYINVECNEKVVTVCVKDEGPGIENGKKKDVFKPFNKLANIEDDTGLKSSGLGLSISKKIIEEHGGRMWLETENDKGCEFYFSIPLEGSNG